MDSLRALRIFTRTMELASLSAVAREIGSTQSSISKILSQLEAQLKVRLLERSTRGPMPTEQGLHFYDQAKSILEQYDAAVSSVQGLTTQPTGLLRINAPVALGQFHLNALVQDFMHQHPAISVELILNDRFVDLVEEGVDVALRLGTTLPPDAIGRRLASVPRFLAAAPAYLRQRGVPDDPDALAAHDFVRFAWSGSIVELHAGEDCRRVATNSRYRVNNGLAIREALMLGSGIGLCPEWLVHDLLATGALVRVLPAWAATPQDLTLLYPSRRYQPVRTKLFIEFISAQLRDLPGFQAHA